MPAQRKIRVGVLALQGAFQLHQPHLESLGVQYIPVVGPKDFEDINGLILPGGESGAMLKLIDTVGIKNELIDCLFKKPSWGICAGAILMAKTVRRPNQRSFGIMDIEIERNAYGRQLESSEELVDDYQVSFIRAPKILKMSEKIRILHERSGSPTWIELGKSMITTFHPEINLNAPSPWHKRFVEFCIGNLNID